jgi:uncharacterized protein (DUF697 family)
MRSPARHHSRQADTIVTAPMALTAPVVWLLGKVQSGKTSIVRTLTGVTDTEIGTGFRATTTTARVFDYPHTAPLIRFLDTRGLGEAHYDPAADISASEGQAHLLLVVMKALDQQQTAVLDVVSQVRERRPDWPILVAQTTLHDGYQTGAAHLDPYPFANPEPAVWRAAGVPDDLARSLARQRSLFDDIPGRQRIVFVPIDFTLPEDGYQPSDYGLPALLSALHEVAPASIVASVRETLSAANAGLAAKAHPQILAYATAAAAADVLPFAGAVAVPGIQAKMLHGLAAVYGVPLNRRVLTEFAGCLGTGTVMRMLSIFGIRELVKLVPWYGQTAGAAAAAAASFATTFAIGKAGTYFLGQRRLGRTDPAGVHRAYAEALKQAFKSAPDRRQDSPQPEQKA